MSEHRNACKNCGHPIPHDLTSVMGECLKLREENARLRGAAVGAQKGDEPVTQFDETTERKAQEYADHACRYEEQLKKTLTCLAINDFTAGRNSVKESLALACRELQRRTTHFEATDGWYSCPLAENYILESNEGTLGECNCGAQTAIETIAAIKAAGNWPLEEKS